eukprot:CAMPEP_0114507670 /NCGR_PEP_ID=MMETSP0109-20121206/12143_1 /TAXON_ID=29199 /ORGANISM="Chlorarachnion reptans, Strain CCCM449" /LENGTH=480 /DNA_ID=CAMNT_0001686457 /DNA_START=296 /DNA_END=1735 /DNA_ORIENTATION=+
MRSHRPFFARGAALFFPSVRERKTALLLFARAHHKASSAPLPIGLDSFALAEELVQLLEDAAERGAVQRGGLPAPPNEARVSASLRQESEELRVVQPNLRAPVRQHGPADLDLLHVLVGHPPRQDLPQHVGEAEHVHGEAVAAQLPLGALDVGALPLRDEALEQLGRHVGHRPHHPGHQVRVVAHDLLHVRVVLLEVEVALHEPAGGSEVADLHDEAATPRAVDEQVHRLEVAVQDALLVRERHAPGGVQAELQPRGEVQLDGRLQDVQERPVGAVLGHDVEVRRRPADPDELHDVGVVELAEQERLLAEIQHGVQGDRRAPESLHGDGHPAEVALRDLARGPLVDRRALQLHRVEVKEGDVGVERGLDVAGGRVGHEVEEGFLPSPKHFDLVPKRPPVLRVGEYRGVQNDGVHEAVEDERGRVGVAHGPGVAVELAAVGVGQRRVVGQQVRDHREEAEPKPAVLPGEVPDGVGEDPNPG